MKIKNLEIKAWRWGRRGTVLIVAATIAVFVLGSGGYALFFASSPEPASTSTNSSVNLSQGLIGHWKLDGNGLDSTPYANNGTKVGIYGSWTSDRKGMTNGSYQSTNNSLIDISNSSAFDISTVSVSVWVRSTLNDQGTLGAIITKSDGVSSPYGFGIAPNGTVCFTDADTSAHSGSVCASSAIYNDSEWHFLVGIRAGGQLSIYLDGQFQASVADTATGISTNASDLRFGDDTSGDNRGAFRGSIDDVRIYNRAISPAEVKALYQSYNDPTNIDSADAGLVGRWKLDGNMKDATPYNTVCTPPASTPSFTPDRKGQASSAMNPPKLGFDCGQPSAPMVPNVTMSAWINMNAFNTEGDGIESYGGTTQFYVDGVSHQLKFTIHDNNNAAHTWSSPGTLNLGQWYFVAATYDGSTVNLYINNSQVATASYTGGIGVNHYNDSANDFLLADYNAASTGRSFKGSMDDIRVYNRALSAEELGNLYNSYNSQINLGISTSPANQVINLTKDLVGYWSFSGNARDSTPYSNNGTANGATLTTNRFGNNNDAYNFSGSAYISVPDSQSLHVGQNYTISMWVKPTTATGTEILLGKEYGGAQLDSYAVYMKNTRDLRFYTAAGQEISSGYSLPADQWSFVTVTVTGGTQLSIFVNGNDVHDDTLSSGTQFDSSPLLFGADNDGSGPMGFLQGSLDDVRIYNRTLSLDEIRALYYLQD